jgi:peptidoglycan hydrolase-like protein with peptidoglycan-binding domain
MSHSNAILLYGRAQRLLAVLVFGVVAAMLPAQTGQVLELTTPRIHNSAVVDLQRFLAWSGYSLGTDGIDGWFGNDTESAVRRYQRDAGMEATGRIRLSEIDFNLTFEPTVEGMLDGNIPASLALGEIWLDEEYHTYFGRFRAEHFYDIPRNMMRIESIGSDALYVEVENDMGKVSPSGRFISVEEIDFYAGDGASALVIADLVSGGVARFEYASFLDGWDVGLRSAFYRT